MPSIVCNPRDLSSEPSIQISTSVMTNNSGIEDTVEDLLGDAITFQPPLDTNQEWSNDLCSLFPKFAEESSTKNATTSYDVSTSSENIDRRDNMGEIKKRIIATDKLFRRLQESETRIATLEKLCKTKDIDNKLIQEQLKVMLGDHRPREVESQKEEISKLKNTIETLTEQLTSLEMSRKLHEDTIGSMRRNEELAIREKKKKFSKEKQELLAEIKGLKKEINHLEKENGALLQKCDVLKANRTRKRSKCSQTSDPELSVSVNSEGPESSDNFKQPSVKRKRKRKNNRAMEPSADESDGGGKSQDTSLAVTGHVTADRSVDDTVQEELKESSCVTAVVVSRQNTQRENNVTIEDPSRSSIFDPAPAQQKPEDKLTKEQRNHQQPSERLQQLDKTERSHHHQYEDTREDDPMHQIQPQKQRSQTPEVKIAKREHAEEPPAESDTHKPTENPESEAATHHLLEGEPSNRQSSEKLSTEATTCQVVITSSMKNRVTEMKTKRSFRSFSRRPNDSQLMHMSQIVQQLRIDPSTSADGAIRHFCTTNFLLGYESYVAKKIIRQHQADQLPADVMHALQQVADGSKSDDHSSARDAPSNHTFSSQDAPVPAVFNLASPAGTFSSSTKKINDVLQAPRDAAKSKTALLQSNRPSTSEERSRMHNESRLPCTSVVSSPADPVSPQDNISKSHQGAGMRSSLQRQKKLPSIDTILPPERMDTTTIPQLSTTSMQNEDANRQGNTQSPCSDSYAGSAEIMCSNNTTTSVSNDVLSQECSTQLKNYNRTSCDSDDLFPQEQLDSSQEDNDKLHVRTVSQEGSTSSQATTLCGDNLQSRDDISSQDGNFSEATTVSRINSPQKIPPSPDNASKVMPLETNRLSQAATPDLQQNVSGLLNNKASPQSTTVSDLEETRVASMVSKSRPATDLEATANTPSVLVSKIVPDTTAKDSVNMGNDPGYSSRKNERLDNVVDVKKQSNEAISDMQVVITREIDMYNDAKASCKEPGNIAKTDTAPGNIVIREEKPDDDVFVDGSITDILRNYKNIVTTDKVNDFGKNAKQQLNMTSSSIKSGENDMSAAGSSTINDEKRVGGMSIFDSEVDEVVESATDEDVVRPIVHAKASALPPSPMKKAVIIKNAAQSPPNQTVEEDEMQSPSWQANAVTLLQFATPSTSSVQHMVPTSKQHIIAESNSEQNVSTSRWLMKKPGTSAWNDETSSDESDDDNDDVVANIRPVAFTPKPAARGVKRTARKSIRCSRYVSSANAKHSLTGTVPKLQVQKLPESVVQHYLSQSDESGSDVPGSVKKSPLKHKRPTQREKELFKRYTADGDSLSSDQPTNAGSVKRPRLRYMESLPFSVKPSTPKSANIEEVKGVDDILREMSAVLTMSLSPIRVGQRLLESNSPEDTRPEVSPSATLCTAFNFLPSTSAAPPLPKKQKLITMQGKVKSAAQEPSPVVVKKTKNTSPDMPRRFSCQVPPQARCVPIIKPVPVTCNQPCEVASSSDTAVPSLETSREADPQDKRQLTLASTSGAFKLVTSSAHKQSDVFVNKDQQHIAELDDVIVTLIPLQEDSSVANDVTYESKFSHCNKNVIKSRVRSRNKDKKLNALVANKDSQQKTNQDDLPTTLIPSIEDSSAVDDLSCDSKSRRKHKKVRKSGVITLNVDKKLEVHVSEKRKQCKSPALQEHSSVCDDVTCDSKSGGSSQKEEKSCARAPNKKLEAIVSDKGEQDMTKLPHQDDTTSTLISAHEDLLQHAPVADDIMYNSKSSGGGKNIRKSRVTSPNKDNKSMVCVLDKYEKLTAELPHRDDVLLTSIPSQADSSPHDDATCTTKSDGDGKKVRKSRVIALSREKKLEALAADDQPQTTQVSHCGGVAITGEQRDTSINDTVNSNSKSHDNNEKREKSRLALRTQGRSTKVRKQMLEESISTSQEDVSIDNDVACDSKLTDNGEKPGTSHTGPHDQSRTSNEQGKALQMAVELDAESMTGRRKPKDSTSTSQEDLSIAEDDECDSKSLGYRNKDQTYGSGPRTRHSQPVFVNRSDDSTFAMVLDEIQAIGASDGEGLKNVTCMNVLLWISRVLPRTTSHDLLDKLKHGGVEAMRQGGEEYMKHILHEWELHFVSALVAVDKLLGRDANFVCGLVLPTILKVLCRFANHLHKTAYLLPNPITVDILKPILNRLRPAPFMEDATCAALTRVYGALCSAIGDVRSLLNMCRVSFTSRHPVALLTCVTQAVACNPVALRARYPLFAQTVINGMLTHVKCIGNKNHFSNMHKTSLVYLQRKQVQDAAVMLERLMGEGDNTAEASMNDPVHLDASYGKLLRCCLDALSGATLVPHHRPPGSSLSGAEGDSRLMALMVERCDDVFYCLEAIALIRGSTYVCKEVVEKYMWKLLHTWSQHVVKNNNQEEGKQVSDACVIAILRALAIMLLGLVSRGKNEHPTQKMLSHATTLFRTICTFLDNFTCNYVDTVPMWVQCAAATTVVSLSTCDQATARATLHKWLLATASRHPHRLQQMQLLYATGDMRKQLRFLDAAVGDRKDTNRPPVVALTPLVYDSPPQLPP